MQGRRNMKTNVLAENIRKHNAMFTRNTKTQCKVNETRTHIVETKKHKRKHIAGKKKPENILQEISARKPIAIEQTHENATQGTKHTKTYRSEEDTRKQNQSKNRHGNTAR